MQFLYNENREVVAEKDYSGNIIRYIRGLGLISSDSENAKTYYHYVCDEQGSVSRIIRGEDKENGAAAQDKVSDRVLNHYEYDAFGNTISCEERVANRFRYQSGSKTINGLNIIDGKVDGKIPLAEYKKYRVDSVHNIDSDTMTLGKYEPTIRADGTKDFSIPGPGAYTVKAGDTTYFSLGTEWDKITDTYGLDVAGQNMFDYFNKPALDDAINAGKEIRFSHNPEAYGECALKWEWDYLQEKHGYFALEKKGDFWYATK